MQVFPERAESVAAAGATFPSDRVKIEIAVAICVSFILQWLQMHMYRLDSMNELPSLLE